MPAAWFSGQTVSISLLLAALVFLAVSYIPSGVRGIRAATSHEGPLAHVGAEQPACPFEDSGPQCSLWKYPGTLPALGLSVHTGHQFTLIHYGQSDFVSKESATGSKFFEQDATELIIWLLKHEAGTAKVQGAKTANGDCIGTGDHGLWFLDVGSNIGVHALAVAAAGFPAVAVEATPATAERLKCSAAVNGMQHLHVIHAAVHHTDGVEMCMAPVAGNFGGNHVEAAGQGCPAEHRTVTTRLDTLLAPDGWRKHPSSGQPSYSGLPLTAGPTVFKLDVEGFENNALQGYLKLFGTVHRPKYILSELVWHFLERSGSSIREVLTLMLERGYRVFSGDLKIEHTRQAILGYPKDQPSADFPGQRGCLANYFFLRSDVPLPSSSDRPLTTCEE